jgi:hypothetical protein
MKDLLISINCEKSICVSRKNKPACDYISGDNIGGGRCVLFNTTLQLMRGTIFYKRCKKCLDAEKRLKTLGYISLSGDE